MDIKKIKDGDKVFHSDGRTGKACEGEDGILWAHFTDGSAEQIIGAKGETYFENFYLVGLNFFGNKIDTAVIEKRAEEQRAICQAENEKLDNLRKQLWTLNERMVPDWKERFEANKAKKAELEQKRMNRTE